MVFGKTQWTPASLLGVSEDQRFTKSDEEQRVHLGRGLRYYHNRLAAKMELSSSEELCWIVCNENVAARVQSGPTCGLVALRMAAEHLPGRVQDTGGDAATQEKDLTAESCYEQASEDGVPAGEALLQHAVALGVTNAGEMFSAVDLATVANSWYGEDGIGRVGKTSVTAVDIHFPDTAHEVVTHLYGGVASGRDCRQSPAKKLIAVPYDSAPNHEPYLGGGSHAHWGLIKGIAVPVLKEALSEERWSEWLGEDCLANSRVYSDVRMIVSDVESVARALKSDIWEDNEDCEDSSGVEGEEGAETSLQRGWMSIRQEEGFAAAAEAVAKGKCCKMSLFVTVQQSKSKNQVVCPFGMLRASNRNLQTVDEERAHQFHMPKGMEELRQHAVLISTAAP